MSVVPLFPLHTDWEVTTLGDAAKRGGGTIQTGPFGSQLHASDYVQEGIPSIMPQNISTDRISENGIARITLEDAERLSKYRVRSGDIVYSRRGDVERRALVRDENDGWLCGTGCLKVSFGRGVVVPAYAAFYLSHAASKAWVVQHAVGATMPNLNTSILSALPFVLPPPNEQETIADALSALDDKIELNRRMNETLEEMARALFRDWFVDFGPTRRQLAGETDPTAIMGHAFPSAKAKTLARHFPATLGEDELPEGWRKAEIASLCDIKSGKRPPVKVNSPDLENSIPVWGGNGVSWFTNQVLFDQPLVITGRVGTLGTVYRVEGDVWVSDNALCLFPHDGYFEHLYQSLQMLDFRALNSGSTQPLLTQSALKKQSCVKPPKETAVQFQEIASLLTKKITANEAENQTLAALLDLLLPKLMSGEIRLQGMEGIL